MVALAPPKLGELRVFQAEPGNKLPQNWKLRIDCSPAVSSDWTLGFSSVFDIAKSSRSGVENDHHIVLTRVYSELYFLHLNCLRGALELVNLETESCSRLHLQLAPGIYDLRVNSDLVLLGSFNVQETLVYDIKSEFCAGKPFVVIKHGTNRRKRADPALFHTYTIATECLLDPAYVRLDDSFILSLAGTCSSVAYKLHELVQYHPNQVESTLFLLRRTGCKALAFTTMTNCILSYSDLTVLSYLFHKLNCAYKQAALDRLRTACSVEAKKYDGMDPVLQADLHSHVFSKLFLSRLVDFHYLSSVLLLYHQSLLTHEIQVHQALNVLLCQLLVDTQDIDQLYGLLQHKVLKDSKELAEELLSTTPDRRLLQLAVDMLARLGEPQKLIEVLIAQDYEYEAVNEINKHRLHTYNTENIFRIVQHIERPEHNHT